MVKDLRSAGFITFGTDVMDGLKFCGHRETTRIAFISHHKQMGYMKGQPDLVAISPCGAVTFIEFKTSNGKQSPEQKAMQAKITSMGLEYLMWNSWRQVKEFISNFDREGKNEVMGGQFSVTSPRLYRERD